MVCINDISLKIIFRSDESDPDYVNPETESDSSCSGDDEFISSEEENVDDQVLLVYRSQLQELLKYCIKCGSLIDNSVTKVVQNTGSQLAFNFRCLNGENIFQLRSQGFLALPVRRVGSPGNEVEYFFRNMIRSFCIGENSICTNFSCFPISNNLVPRVFFFST